MICAKRVFRCFKTVERWGNYITGAAGPFFVGLAVILMSMGTVCFCMCTLCVNDLQLSSLHFSVDVIAPDLSFPLLSTPLCILIAANLFAHYYYVVTVPPGYVGEPPREPGTSFLWAQKRRPLTSGVRWSSRGLKITQAASTKCIKCATTRPEVRILCLFRVLV